MKNKYYHYHIDYDFCISDLEYCGEGRTVDMTVFELYKDKNLLKKMDFHKDCLKNLNKFLIFLASIDGIQNENFANRLMKLISNPMIRILDNSKSQKILKKQLRKKKLEKIDGIFK